MRKKPKKNDGWMNGQMNGRTDGWTYQCKKNEEESKAEGEQIKEYRAQKQGKGKMVTHQDNSKCHVAIKEDEE